MNAKFDAWWLARGAMARRMLKFVLGFVAVVGLLLFASFNMSASGKAGSGTKQIVTIGQPGPWLVCERITASGLTAVTNEAVVTMGMTAKSGVKVFSSSFVAGVLAFYSMVLLGRIRRIEKQR